MSDAPTNQGISQGFPNNIFDFVEPQSGRLTPIGYRFLLALWLRTGGGGGSNANITTGYLTMGDIPDVPAQNAGVSLLYDQAEQAPASASMALLWDAAETVRTQPAAEMSAEMATMQDVPKTYPGLWAMAITDES